MAFLTDLAIRRTKPARKPYTMKDCAGLYHNVKCNGTKNWLFRFYWLGAQKRISFGTYPMVGIKQARSLRQQAQDLLGNGIDPRSNRNLNRGHSKAVEPAPVSEGISFAQYAERWKEFKLKKLRKENLNSRQSTRVQIERYMRKDMLPVLGKRLPAWIY